MLNWGLIGAGSIAKVFCNGMRFSKTGRIAAVASRSKDRAAELASAFSIPKVYHDYESLLADGQIDVVYINTIHPAHAEWVIEAARAGKHILVEKPIGLNSQEAAAMVEAAQVNDVFLMEAFMYRCHPQTQKLAELVREGVIGQVQIIRSVFSYNAAFNPTSKTYTNELGGGGILDVGCYPASMTRLIAGAASGKPFLNPMEVKGTAKIGPTGVDHYAAATLHFENDIIAEIITGVNCQMPVEVSIYGTDGILSVPNPWLPSSPCRSASIPLPLDTVFPPTSIQLKRHAEPNPEEITITPDRDLFTYEADMVAANIDDRQSPAMNWQDTLGNMQLLDQWRRQGGVVYPQDNIRQ
ncbi:MAG: Gfo/Idh/MocA family protein [Anaerolineales bacterium]